MRLQNPKKKSVFTLPYICSRLFAILYFVVLKSLGLLPWRFNFIRLIRWEQSLNYYNLGYYVTFNQMYFNVCLSLFLCYQNYNYFFYESGSFPKNVGLLTDGATKYCQGLSLVSYVMPLMTYMFKQETIMDILNRMPSMDQQLAEISGRKVNNGVVIYFLFFFNLSTTIALSVLKAIDLYDKPFEQIFVTVMPSVYYSWMIIHYVLMLDTLIRRIQVINSAAKNAKYGDKLCFGPKDKIDETKKSVNEEIKCLSEIFDELVHMWEGLVLFYSISLFVAGLNIVGIATFISYDITWNLETLQPAEIQIYQFWYSNVVIDVLLLALFWYRIDKEVKQTRAGLQLLFKRYYSEVIIEVDEEEKMLNDLLEQVEVHREDLSSIYGSIP